MSLLPALDTLESHATSFFKQAAEAVQIVGTIIPYPTPSALYWERLSRPLQADAIRLVREVLHVGEEVFPLVQASPALTEADTRDVGFALKEMRSALQLRRYRHWDADLLYDEDSVRGVRPAGQSDDEAIEPYIARGIFREAVTQLQNILQLTFGPLRDPPSANRGIPLTERRIYRPGTAFVIMWMDPAVAHLEDVVTTVKRCFKRHGITAVRADDIQHEDLITKQVLEQIRTAEFIFADLTGARPSVYYEIGYAHALGRRVMLFREKGTAIHFDLAAHNCPEYRNLGDLERLLLLRLEAVTGEAPVEAAKEDYP